MFCEEICEFSVETLIKFKAFFCGLLYAALGNSDHIAKVYVFETFISQNTNLILCEQQVTN
jgi:hypothetical protein